MTHQPNPNDPYVATPTADDDLRRRQAQARLDNELQAAEPIEAPASSGKIAMFAVAIAVVLGAAFYGLNNTTINQAGTSTTAQNSQVTSPPAAPPGMRDVTPRTNSEPGMTTGAAPSRPANPAPADTTAPSK